MSKARPTLGVEELFTADKLLRDAATEAVEDDFTEEARERLRAAALEFADASARVAPSLRSKRP